MHHNSPCEKARARGTLPTVPPKDRALPPITLPSTTAVANTATIISETFRAPSRTTILVSAEEEKEEAKDRKPAKRVEPQPTPAIVLDPLFKWALIAVAVITGVSFVAEMVLASLWTEPATHFQETAFAALDWAFKGGVGVFIGLIGGKQA